MLSFEHLDPPAFLQLTCMHSAQYIPIRFSTFLKNIWLKCYGLYENLAPKIHWTTIVSSIHMAMTLQLCYAGLDIVGLRVETHEA